MRYVFIGAVGYSDYCLNVLCRMGANITAVFCPRPEAALGNADYKDLGPTAKRYKIPVYYFERMADQIEILHRQKPDVIFVLGLSQIIPKVILRLPTVGCIGSHPALLPQNRGRHPIIWALANGLPKSGVTLFWLDEGVDSGDIWVQQAFTISKQDDAARVYEKIKRISGQLLRRNIPQLERGIVRRVPQQHTKANYWRKRGIEDGKIDWRMSGEQIFNLVRALSRPYVGAHCLYKEEMRKIWKARVLDGQRQHENIEPGKVIKIKGKRITLKTGDRLIELLEHEIDPLPKAGEYL